MRLPSTTAAAALVALAALTVAGPAGSRTTADPPAELFVTPLQSIPGAAAETDIELSVPDSSSLAVASVAVYLPAGYALNLTRPAGTVVGRARVFLGDQPNRVAADIVAVDPAPFATDPKAQACASGAHAAVWTASFSVAGAPLAVTIFVDRTSPEEASRGSVRLLYCLPSPSVTPDQGGSPNGARIVGVDLDLDAATVTNPASGGALTWHAIVTPYQSGTGTPVPAGAFELRSLVWLPQILTLKGTYAVASGTLVLTGQLLALGLPRDAVSVHLFSATKANLSDLKELGAVATTRDGTYSFRKKVARRKTVQKLILIAIVNPYVAACDSAPPLVPGGCAEESLAPPLPKLTTALIPRLLPKKR